MSENIQAFKKTKRIRRHRSIVCRSKQRKAASIPRKSLECMAIIDSKTCEKCKSNDSDHLFVLCDECDDAYHWSCLDPPLIQAPPEDQEWLCPNCVIMDEEPQQQSINVPSERCYKCHIEFTIIPINLSEYSSILRNTAKTKPIQCLICLQWFHQFCFSVRSNSLNCQNCEQQLRKKCPKGHFAFLEFLKEQKKLIFANNYLQLSEKKLTKNDDLTRTTPLNLRLSDELTDWQLIVKYQASLFYALQSKKLIFCDQQLYENFEIMKLNNASKEVIKVFPLAIKDEEVYQQFKSKTRKGAVGPYEIKEDRTKGFYVVATANLLRGTIICEYVGEISRHRDSLQQKNNDSIFTLLMTGSSQQDLNITPNKFGNMSRFICGVNNSSREATKNINVKAVRFSYQGRVRIIFIAKKDIQKGDSLYLNYNAGTYEEYPTQNFVV